MFEVIKNEREEVLEMLRCDELVLSREGECKPLPHIDEKTYDQLLSTQEEAGTKIIAHAAEILHQDTENKVVIRPPSGDTDILILSAELLYNFKEHVIIDNGSGQSRGSASTWEAYLYYRFVIFDNTSARYEGGCVKYLCECHNFLDTLRK